MNFLVIGFRQPYWSCPRASGCYYPYQLGCLSVWIWCHPVSPFRCCWHPPSQWYIIIGLSWFNYLSIYILSLSLSHLLSIYPFILYVGANMKISNSDPVPTAAAYSNSGTLDHWRVAYWTEATTEPGSSGSPLYDAGTKRIIGQLHGGTARCPSFRGYDDYGAIWASYAQNTGSLLGSSSMNGRTLY